ncbi:hypothetical protein PSV30_13835 [Yersinia pestis]|nr:hypothetical protein [Yersinia pestis]MDL1707471.1 hypothetical protein [Yersinia pestis]MDL1723442.1 hypothetical protein [Yersinia pestis]MDL1727478.1 hypothetical protein [Yersinia pestis]MDL1838500.1 hypothetical protein [Yersinia pestis]
MAKIQVRNFPDDLYSRLEEIAAMSERSIEGQARLILKEALEDKPTANKPDNEPPERYKQIMPSTDWYFRHDNVEGCSTKSTVYQLAAWALTHEGDIVGLVTVRDIETGRPKLVTPPPVAGDYLHKEQLEADEVLASKRR